MPELLARGAGFELGSGRFINTMLPETAAQFLRNRKVDAAAETQAASAGVAQMKMSRR